MRNVIEIFNFIATQTKTTKKYDFVDKYGKSNVIIAAICMICLIVNSIFISEAKLNQIESSRLAVYLVNFLHNGYGSAQRMYVKRGYIPDGTGVWYRGSVCPQYTDCCNDDDLVLYLSKKLR